MEVGGGVGWVDVAIAVVVAIRGTILKLDINALDGLRIAPNSIVKIK